MSKTEFTVVCPYRAVPNLGRVPAVEMDLFYGGARARLVGVLDSGSSATVVSRAIAEALGIQDITAGERSMAHTVAGSLIYYVFDMDVGIRLPELTRRFPGRIGFFAGVTSRNILGKNLIFSHFEIAFRERTQELKFRPEETEGASWTL